MKKAGISMVALVITIIVLIVLTSAVVITGVGVPKQAQLAVFYSNIDTVQELVTLKMSDNMITGALNGYGENYKWVDIVENYTAEKGQANEQLVFDEYQINGVWLEPLSQVMLKNNTSLAEGERSKYYVSSQGTVYHEGFVYEGQTYYTKNADPVENGQTLTSMLPTNGSFNEEKGVNSPKLLPGMTAVYWDANGNEVTSTNPGADTEFYNNWYDYIEQTNTTEEGGTSKWANTKTADGSYWVWIPRYAYSITSGYHGEGLTYTGETPETYEITEMGTIDIEFLKGKTNEGTSTRTSWDNESGANNWNIHPAFTVEGTELAGIWVAKYEMSMETNGIYTETIDSTIGDITTIQNSAIKAVSKPGVSSWRYIAIGNMFTNGYNYDRAKESHLMKNNEWGAVVYLAHSIYGRNTTDIEINENTDYYTGGENGATALTNVTQSTTGNEYGIYDISGGAWERVAAYFTSEEESIIRETHGGDLLTANIKYKDLYTDYDNTATVYGEAMYETSLNISVGWHGVSSGFVDGEFPFFKRGGNDIDGSGTFTFVRSRGFAVAPISWRVVLWGSLQ